MLRTGPTLGAHQASSTLVETAEIRATLGHQKALQKMLYATGRKKSQRESIRLTSSHEHESCCRLREERPKVIYARPEQQQSRRNEEARSLRAQSDSGTTGVDYSMVVQHQIGSLLAVTT